MSVLGLQRGVGRELHISCIRGKQAVVRGQTGTWPRPENEKGELQEVSWKDKAGSGRDQKCLILQPRSAARGEPCSTGADVGRENLPQPGAKCWVTRGEQALGPKAFQCHPSTNKPPSSPLVFCARLCPPHTSHRYRGWQRLSSSSTMSGHSQPALRATTCPQREARHCRG